MTILNNDMKKLILSGDAGLLDGLYQIQSNLAGSSPTDTRSLLFLHNKTPSFGQGLFIFLIYETF